MICSLQHLHENVSNLGEYLDQFADGQIDSPSKSSITLNDLSLIEKHFSKGSLPEIFRSLETAAAECEWSRRTLEVMGQMSPTSMAVTFALLEKGRKMSLKRCLNMEYTLARSFITRVPDMKNGITTKLIKKEKSVTWSPASVSEVDPKFIESLFNAPRTDDGLSFYNERDDYEHYPHAAHTLPSLHTIKQIVQDASGFGSEQELIDFICRQYSDRVYLRQWLNELFHSHVDQTTDQRNMGVKFQWK